MSYIVKLLKQFSVFRGVFEIFHGISKFQNCFVFISQLGSTVWRDTGSFPYHSDNRTLPVLFYNLGVAEITASLNADKYFTTRVVYYSQ